MFLLRRPFPLLVYASGTLGLLSFFYTKYFGSTRHHGFLFVLFLASAWLSRQREATYVGSGAAACFRFDQSGESFFPSSDPSSLSLGTKSVYQAHLISSRTGNARLLAGIP